MEWEGNRTNDSIADAVMAVLLSIESSPAAIKQSSKLHSHAHDSGPAEKQPTNGFDEDATRNPLANLTAEEKLNRLFMFLEAQFGEEAVSPIAEPKLAQPNGAAEEMDDVEREKASAAELERLHDLGIPVPGVEVRVDKMTAKVWLEKLEVECANKSFADRVRAVVERSMETIAPLWQ